jgi:ribosomal protein L7Ae-like RNA K-turn-binding protein
MVVEVVVEVVDKAEAKEVEEMVFLLVEEVEGEEFSQQMPGVCRQKHIPLIWIMRNLIIILMPESVWL